MSAILLALLLLSAPNTAATDIPALLEALQQGDAMAEARLVELYSAPAPISSPLQQHGKAVLEAFEKLLRDRAFELQLAKSPKATRITHSEILKACAIGNFPKAACKAYQQAYSPTICFMPLDEFSAADFMQ